MPESKKRPVALTLLLVLVGAAALGGCGFLALAFFAFGSSLCGNTLVSETPSPDGRHRAVFFSHSCGATDGGSWGLSVIPAAERLTDDTGFNVFWTSEYPAAFAVRWLGDQTLEVAYDQPWTEYLSDREGGFGERENRVGRVSIVYRDSVSATGAENALCCAFGHTPAGRARAESLR